MKEEFVGAAWKDFQQRYHNTFGWFHKEDGTQLLVKLVAVEKDKLRFIDKRGIDFYASPDKGNEFTFIPVERGVYDTDEGILFVRRVAVKQYRRGICVENTFIRSLSSRERFDVTFPILEKIFGEPSSNLLDLFRAKLAGDVVFDNVFSIVNNKLYLYDTVIGTYANTTLTLGSKLFKQEVSDLITKLQLPLLVEVKNG
jgi:hypothetical protein